MSSVTVEDADEVVRKVPNQAGMIYVGRKYTGQELEVVLRVVDSDDE